MEELFRIFEIRAQSATVPNEMFFIKPAYLRIIMCVNKCLYIYEYAISIWSNFNEHMNEMVYGKWKYIYLLLFFAVIFFVARMVDEIVVIMSTYYWNA